MDWNIGWLFFGAAAFLLALVSLARAAAGRRKGWEALQFSSLSCGALALLAEYRMVAQWLDHGDLAAVCDVVPTMSRHLTAALAIGLGLNLLALLLHTRAKR